MLPTTLYAMAMPHSEPSWRVILRPLVIAYDIVARIKGGNNATISLCTLTWSEQWPVIAFVTGFVMGHIFWPCR